MRWWVIVVVPMCLGFDERPSSNGQTELGVLSCALGQSIDTASTDQKTAASEAREMACFFRPGTNGPTVRSIAVAGKLPDRFTIMWVVTGPWGTRPTAGLLQQKYAIDEATPAGQVPPLIGERNANIILHAMADKREGIVSQEKQPRPDYVLSGVELLLKASSG